MSETNMRAKMAVGAVIPGNGYEVLHFNAVAKSGGYPEDGADENNSFAKWSPSAHLQIHVANPDLFGKFKPGDTFYVDFTPAPK